MGDFADSSTSSEDENEYSMTLRLKTPVRNGYKSKVYALNDVERSPLREMHTGTNIPRPSTRKSKKRAGTVRASGKRDAAETCEEENETKEEEYRETIRALRKQIHSMACQMEARSRHVIERITSSQDPQGAEAVELQEEVEILREKLAAKSRAVELLEREKQSLSSDVSHLRNSFSENKKHHRLLKELKTSNRESKAMAENLERQLQAKDSELEQLRVKQFQTVKSLQDEVLKERENLFSERLQDQNKYEEQIESLNKTLQAQRLAFEAELVEATRTSEETVAFQKREFDATVLTLRAQVNTLEQKILALETTLTQSTEQRDALSRQLADEKEESADSEKTLVNAQQTMLNETGLLRQRIEALNLSLEEKAQHFTAKSEQLVDSVKLSKKLHAQVVELQAELFTLRQTEQASKNEAVRQQEAKTRKELELRELKERCSAQAHELKKLSKTKFALEELRRIVERSNVQRDQDQETITTLKSNLAGSNGRVQQLQLALETELRSRAVLSEHNIELQSEQEEMRENKKKFDELKRDIATMREKLLDGALETETRLLYETEIKRYKEETERMKEHIKQLELSKKQYRSLLQAYTTDSPEEPTLLQNYAETIHQLTVELENYEAGSKTR